MYCKFCGKEIDNDSTFCKHCGKSLVVKQKVVIEFNKPNIDNITATSKTLFSKITTFWNKCKTLLKAIITTFWNKCKILLQVIFGFIAFSWGFMFPVSFLCWIIGDFFDISTTTIGSICLVCSMLLAAFVTYLCFKSK